ncbi:MAG TPA: hypothetical protein VF766_12660 [Pyrinomonadaceae bacterium]
MTSAIFSFLLIINSVLAQPVSTVKEAALDQEFEIKVGQRVSIKSEGLLISFSSIAEDSRCPEGVQCVWAGNVKVVLKVSKARKRFTTLRLNTNLDPTHSAYRQYDVKLVGISPNRKKDVPVKRSEYVATLMVSRK